MSGEHIGFNSANASCDKAGREKKRAAQKAALLSGDLKGYFISQTTSWEIPTRAAIKPAKSRK